ncbi:MAG: pirin family protein [Burkholderiales bacterium]|nr:pirin family protein [Burkholderiales bacterium]
MITIRPGQDRGHANHGWLKSFHSFSFADYYDPAHMGFGALRVINEDRVAPGAGFGTHGHRDMEIISYVLDGALAHKDSIGTGAVMQKGDVQRMSAGRGVLHSEFNHSTEQQVHFLQIWIEPSEFGIPAEYEQRHFSDAEKKGRLLAIASPVADDGSLMIHQDATIYAGIFDGGDEANLPIKAGRRAYVHVVRGTVVVNGVTLNEGDAAQLVQENAVQITNGDNAEVLVFDLA